jgi:hypothetical protein
VRKSHPHVISKRNKNISFIDLKTVVRQAGAESDWCLAWYQADSCFEYLLVCLYSFCSCDMLIIESTLLVYLTAPFKLRRMYSIQIQNGHRWISSKGRKRGQSLAILIISSSSYTALRGPWPSSEASASFCYCFFLFRDKSVFQGGVVSPTPNPRLSWRADVFCQGCLP